MNVLIADDHAIVRKGLIQLLSEGFPDIEVIEAVNSADVISAIRSQDLDIILMDISMPGRNGIETLKQIRLEGVRTPVLMLSMHPEDQYALRSLKAGASGFINKESATIELLAAVKKVLGGGKYISPSVAEKLADAVSEKGSLPGHENLSDREMEVLQQIATGKTVSEIAEYLSLSVNTISTYRTRLLEKLRLNNNAEITRYAIENRLV
jgi:Response regulator containing a CheY-like receiver domain and an HTH DNA-binding domain